MSVSNVSYVPFDASAIISGGSGTVDESKLIDDQTTYMYIGTAVPGTATSASAWKIKKVVFSGGTTTILYANGSSTATNAWNSRASFTYS